MYSSDEYSLESFDGGEKEIDEELKRLTGNDDQPQTPKPTEPNNCQSLIPISGKILQGISHLPHNHDLKEKGFENTLGKG